MILKDLPEDARPREKLLARGPAALSDAELLALLLRTGMPGKNVLQMGQELLDTFGGLAGLLHTTADDLKRIKGLGGTAKRAAAGRRAGARPPRAGRATERKNHPVRHAQAVRDYLQLQLGSRPHEVFAVLFLDSQHRLIALEELFRGTLTQTSRVPARGRRARPGAERRQRGAGPQPPQRLGQPSRADEALTQTLKAALALVDVRVLDHFVVTSNQAVSMAELGLL
jgi:DNA repair protein RadC